MYVYVCVFARVNKKDANLVTSPAIITARTINNLKMFFLNEQGR